MTSSLAQYKTELSSGNSDENTSKDEILAADDSDKMIAAHSLPRDYEICNNASGIDTLIHNTTVNTESIVTPSKKQSEVFVSNISSTEIFTPPVLSLKSVAPIAKPMSGDKRLDEKRPEAMDKLMELPGLHAVKKKFIEEYMYH
eukprot:CAMPEP_0182436292 /NCGR_PEP_ID=MMETSP1167-20130531/80764_1 /TAXON_ID=2988 /ORGANISM="Mallomonas Sp, Strain CCMP3275" /LENGTH=143 /DNA_ID=CAMNT_0024628309 /DNA_START=88 /DNA_END=516 /DNA_ORIENTATION=+